MKSFEYATPRTVDEAVEQLADKWGETEVLAGGTDLVTCLKQGLTAPARVVSLKAVKGLKGISSAKVALTIGAMTTMGELADNAKSCGMQPVSALKTPTDFSALSMPTCTCSPKIISRCAGHCTRSTSSR